MEYLDSKACIESMMRHHNKFIHVSLKELHGEKFN